MAFLKQIALTTLAACSGLLLLGCQPSDPSSPKVASLSSIAIAPAAVTLDVGGMQSLTTIGTFSDGSTRDVSFGSTFVSSASTVASVSSTGLVSAVAPGSATITATHTASGKSATAQVTVAPLRVISIAVTPASADLAPGGSQQLRVTAQFNDATTGDVTADSTFVSSDPAVATVGAAGLVSAVAVGAATITATHTATGQTAAAAVTVDTQGGPGELVDGVWSSSYSQVDDASWKTAEGGDASTYIDDSVGTQYWWFGASPPTEAVPHYYFGYGISTAARPWGFGTFVKAPNNTAADVSGYVNLRIAVWGNDELMSTQPTLTVLLRGPEVDGCTAELKGEIAVQGVGAQTYTLPLAGFTLQTPCGAATVDEALADGLLEVHLQVLGDNVQYVTTADPNGFYPNGLNVGPISFE
jgi:hypothetical protein